MGFLDSQKRSGTSLLFVARFFSQEFFESNP